MKSIRFKALLLSISLTVSSIAGAQIVLPQASSLSKKTTTTEAYPQKELQKLDDLKAVLKKKQELRGQPEEGRLQRKLETLKLGTETAGGGAEQRKLFYDPLTKALTNLSEQTEYVFKSKFQKDVETKVVVLDLVEKLRSAALVPVSQQLYDRQGHKVDFLNNPDENWIQFNVEAWTKLPEVTQVQFGLHEIMGLLRIPDPMYMISGRLAEMAVGADTNDKKGKLTVCGITVRAIGELNPGTTREELLSDIASRFKQRGAVLKVCEVEALGIQGATVLVSIFSDTAEALYWAYPYTKDRSYSPPESK